MSINQDIRFTNSQKDPNNPKGLYDFIKPPRNIKGSGLPSSSLGENEWMYLDETSGIQYVKNAGIWESFADIGSFATIPDPLAVSEVNTPLVSASASKLLLTSFTGAGEGVQIGKNCDMLGNDLAEVGAVTGANGTFTVSSGTAAASKLVLQAAGAGGNVELNPIGDLISMKGDVDCETNDILNIGTATATEYVMDNGVQTVRVLVDGPGGPTVKASSNLSLSGGVGFSVIAKSDLSLNNNAIINLAAINNSDVLTTSRNLGVDQAGSLEFRELPFLLNFVQNAFGGIGTSYLGYGAVVGPGSFWASSIGPQSKKLRAVSARLIYNAPWSFGGGTAVVEIGTLANNVAADTTNFVLLYTLNLNTAGDFYEASVQGLSDLIAAGSSIVVRTVLTGTSSTSVNAELAVTVLVQ